MTDKDRIRCIMVYPNAQFQILDERWGIITFDMEGIDLVGSNLICENEYLHVSKCTLLLRPISSLTDEEIFSIYQSIGLRPLTLIDDFSLDGFLAQFSPYVITENDNRHSSGNYYKVYCQLLELNINMPVHGFDLVAEGVAIVDETKTNSNEQ